MKCNNGRCVYWVRLTYRVMYHSEPQEIPFCISSEEEVESTQNFVEWVTNQKREMVQKIVRRDILENQTVPHVYDVAVDGIGIVELPSTQSAEVKEEENQFVRPESYNSPF